MQRTTILSPHADDAVLSLWALLEGSGDVGVINVFDGAPGGEHEVGWWDQLTHADNAVIRAEERRAEDRAALGLVGRSAQSLGFLDGQYRRGEPDLDVIVERLVRAIPEASAVLAPAALGEHVDHLHTRTAGLALRERGVEVALYADVPHAAPNGWPSWVSGAPCNPELDPSAKWERSLELAGLSLRELFPQVRTLDIEEQARKRCAVACYETQLPGLEASFSLSSRPEVLHYEVIWRLS